MKKIFLWSLCAYAFLWTGCGDSGDDFTGTYEIIFMSATQCDDADLNFSYDFSNDNCIMDLGIELCVDGSFTLLNNETFNASFTIMTLGVSVSESLEGTYTVDGNNITICDDTNDCETGTINSAGNEITLRFPEDEDNCILVLRGKK